MDVHSDCVEPPTPVMSFDNVTYRAEDSGYHTSYTPSSISTENIDPSPIPKLYITGQIKVDCFKITPEVNIHAGRKYRRYKNASTRDENYIDTPITRRGIKRPHQGDGEETENHSMPTPTSMIRGGIERLVVNDGNVNKSFSNSTVLYDVSNTVNQDLLHQDSFINTLSYPTTPVKKICKSNCKLSPFSVRRSTKKLNFTIHSLSCESQGLMRHAANTQKPKVVRSFQFDQKIDIIRKLYESNAYPAIVKILDCLSGVDITNFMLVNNNWNQIWDDTASSTIKQRYKKYLRTLKQNEENKDKGIIPNLNIPDRDTPLRDLNNLINSITSNNIPSSPPGTPRTNRFKRFAKTASLDSRTQLSCVRCHQPAKVTKEASGEEWAACTSTTCSYQFCRSCQCDRHPGKTCFQYDLNGPSPSKRKKDSYAVGTKKSRKNLRRLLQ